MSHGKRELGAIATALALTLVARPAAAAGSVQIMPDPLMLVFLIIAFAIVIAPINALIFKPLFRVLDEREARIDGARGRAQTVEAEADEVLARYEAAVASAREQAADERKQQLERARDEEKAATGDARQEAEGEIERARAVIADSLQEARTSIRPRAEELAREAAQRILGREVA